MTNRVALGIAVLLMLMGAVLLVAGVGPSVLWFAAIAVGIALVLILRTGGTKLMHH